MTQNQTHEDSNLSIDSKSSITFFSWQRSVLLATIPGIILVIYIAISYGMKSLATFERGTWFVLGGFNLFYPTALFLLVFITIMMFGILFTMFKIEIKKNDNGTLTIIEKRWNKFAKTTEFEMNKLKLVKFENGRFGTKMLWMFVLGTHAVYLLNDGLHLLLSPVVFGYGIENGLLYVVTGIVDIIMLLMIVLPGEDHLELHTEEEFYIMRFHILQNKEIKIQKINSILGFPTCSVDTSLSANKHEVGQIPVKPSMIATKYLYFGILFWTIAIFSRIWDLYAGMPLRLALYYTGWVMILYSIKFRIDQKKKSEIVNIIPPDAIAMTEIHTYTKTAQSHILLRDEDKKIQLEILNPTSNPTLLNGSIIVTIFFMVWTFMTRIRFAWGVTSQIGWSILFLLISVGILMGMFDIFLESGVAIRLKSSQFPIQVGLPYINIREYFTNSENVKSKPFWTRWLEKKHQNPTIFKKILITIGISILLGVGFAFFFEF